MIALSGIERWSHSFTFFIYVFEYLFGRNILVHVLSLFHKYIATVLQLRTFCFFGYCVITCKVIVEADSSIIWYTTLACVRLLLAYHKGWVEFWVVYQSNGHFVVGCGVGTAVLHVVDSGYLLDLRLVHSEAFRHLFWSNCFDCVVKLFLYRLFADWVTFWEDSSPLFEDFIVFIASSFIWTYEEFACILTILTSWWSLITSSILKLSLIKDYVLN